MKLPCGRGMCKLGVGPNLLDVVRLDQYQLGIGPLSKAECFSQKVFCVFCLCLDLFE